MFPWLERRRQLDRRLSDIESGLLDVRRLMVPADATPAVDGPEANVQLVQLVRADGSAKYDASGGGGGPPVVARSSLVNVRPSTGIRQVVVAETDVKPAGDLIGTVGNDGAYHLLIKWKDDVINPHRLYYWKMLYSAVCTLHLSGNNRKAGHSGVSVEGVFCVVKVVMNESTPLVSVMPFSVIHSDITGEDTVDLGRDSPPVYFEHDNVTDGHVGIGVAFSAIHTANVVEVLCSLNVLST